MNRPSLLLVLCALASVAIAAQAPAPLPLSTVVERAAAYADRFHEQFGSVVAEERYEQTMRSAGSTAGTFLPQETVLRSDFLLVKVANQWLPFRDVFERDGRPVRDRQDRLAKLFLGGATDAALNQARQIMNESARYNIGNGTRTINVPTLPLMFLAPDVRGGLSFSDAKPDTAGRGRVVAFEEVGRPTLIHTTESRDLPARGRFWVQEDDGAITRADVRAEDTAVLSQVIVTFQPDANLGTWVPVRMEERFRRRRDTIEVRGVATYSNFRRFKVNTSESLVDDTSGP